MNVSLPASMSALAITWFNATSVPSSSRAPARSRAVIFTLASSSPSKSEKPKSHTAKMYAVSSSVLTVPFEAVGRVFTVMM